LKKVPTQQHTLITTPNDELTIITFPLFKLLSPVIHLEFDYTTMEHYTPIGPISDNLLVDVYSLEKVRENHCVASVAKNISNYLTNKASDENIKYLAICIPAYNEEFEEMLKTLITLMENVEFMKKKVVFCFLLLCLSFIFSFLSFPFFSFLSWKATKISEFREKEGLLDEFKKTVPVLVPIFDGTRALSGTMKEWIQENFPSMLDDLIASPEDANKEKLANDPEVKIGCAEWYYLCEEGVSKVMKKKQKEKEIVMNEQQQKKDDLLKLEEIKEDGEARSPYLSPTRNELKASSSLYQQMVSNRNNGSPFESNDNEVEMMMDFLEVGNREEDNLSDNKKEGKLSKKELFQQLTLSLNIPFSTTLTTTTASAASSSSSSSSPLLPFYLCPIIKKSNHRKHNSHQWFFDAICEGLNEHIVYALLTDCGTSYSTECLTRLFADLYSMPDLIGVTARMRVETPNRFFHPCLDSPFPFLQGISLSFVSFCCFSLNRLFFL
jgi:hypothetical protein